MTLDEGIFDHLTTHPGLAAQGTTGVYIDLRGATLFGYDEFARRVAEAQAQNIRRAGVWSAA